MRTFSQVTRPRGRRRRGSRRRAASRTSRAGSFRASVAPLRASRRRRASSTSTARLLTGKILPVSSILVATPSASKNATVSRGPSAASGGVQELPVRAERLDDAAGVAVVGDVAARAAGHEDLDARLLPLLQQEHAAAALGGADRGHQPGRAGADDDRVVVERWACYPSVSPCILKACGSTNPEFLWLIAARGLVVAWWWARRPRPAMRFSDIVALRRAARRASVAGGVGRRGATRAGVPRPRPGAAPGRAGRTNGRACPPRPSRS